MSTPKINDMVIRFANVNGTGSASANNIFSKAVFRMGIPVSPKNIFPSNIQGLPTWYEVRISGQGYLGRRAGIDLLVGMNAQSLKEDIDSVRTGGYFLYDNSRVFHEDLLREDIHMIGVPMMKMCNRHFKIPRTRQLLKNIVYVGALAALLNIELEVIQEILREQFARKEKLIPPNFKALELGYDYIVEHFDFPLSIRLQRIDEVGNRILIDGNTATGLGAVFAGATVGSWYPITPSTSVVQAFEKFCNQYRVDLETGQKRFAVVQAEDELAAMGMVLGATWNGARAFTATSGPGVSLMSELIGLAFYAEIPVVLVNVQRGGPSTGMPTRTQQGDLISSAYASHGDTKHPLLFPANPTECFEMTALAFDLADRLQTPIIVMSDLDLGMNMHMTDPLQWDESKIYDKGKVLTAEDLDAMDTFGRYLDTDGDGIPYRTLPGTHPTKGSFFTRGTSKDEYARYTESGEVYVRMMDRITRKWETTKAYVPSALPYQSESTQEFGLLFFGTSTYAAEEALDLLREEHIEIDALRIRAFPFGGEVESFIQEHQTVFVIEQNRDAQFRSILINELGIIPDRLVSVLNYDGLPVTAAFIVEKLKLHLGENHHTVSGHHQADEQVLNKD